MAGRRISDEQLIEIIEAAIFVADKPVSKRHLKDTVLADLAISTLNRAACAAVILRETLGISKIACIIFEAFLGKLGSALATNGTELEAKILSADTFVPTKSISSFSEINVQPGKTKINSDTINLYILLFTSLLSALI